jgi:hypothetical protein
VVGGFDVDWNSHLGHLRVTYSLTQPLAGHKIIQDRTHGPKGDPGHNDYGSRTPVIEDDPEWRGFSVPEDLRVTPRT